MIKDFRNITLASISVLLIAGCATGPQYKDVAASIPTLASDQGRVYFFRPDSFGGAMIQPEIKLNEHVVGHSVPGGFFYVDEAPGEYTVSTSTEVTRSVDFTLRAGETKYVRTSVTMGILVGHITPSLDDPETAPKQIEVLKYTGSSISPVPSNPDSRPGQVSPESRKD
jgi:hypothetical protein